jgi:DNA-directed RNA polymerase specialized sigma24 family protein
MNNPFWYTAIVVGQSQFCFRHPYVRIVKIMPVSDEILITWVARGDSHALEMLYDRHAAMVLGILVRILGERTVAENLLQETFWQVWQSARTYSSQTGALTGWLFRIARSLALAEIQTRVKTNGKIE